MLELIQNKKSLDESRKRQGREGGFENIKDLDHKGPRDHLNVEGKDRARVSVDATPMSHPGERELSM